MFQLTFQLTFSLKFWLCTLFKFYFTPFKVGCYDFAQKLSSVEWKSCLVWNLLKTPNIKRRFHFHVATHVMCPWSFISLTSFNCFFKSIRISWSNFYQLQVLMLTLSTHDIMIFGWMNGKLASENLFWKWILRKEKMIKWMFQTLAVTSKLNNFTNMGFYGFLFSIPVLTRKKTKH